MTLLSRWSPLSDSLALRAPLREMSRLVDDLMRTTDTSFGTYPPCDVGETGDTYTVTVEIPGLKKEDIHLNVQDNVLMLRLIKQQTHEEEGRNFRHVERFYGTFERQFPFPSSIDASKVTASYKDGVLEVVLPKSENARSRSIDVQVK